VQAAPVQVHPLDGHVNDVMNFEHAGGVVDGTSEQQWLFKQSPK
jgi:hypothetical protein